MTTEVNIVSSSNPMGMYKNEGLGSNLEPPQASIQQMKNFQGPIAIFWDIENCPVPTGVRSEDAAGNVRMTLRAHPVVKGAVTHFSAYGDFNAFPRRLREGCQKTGVKLVDVPNGRKDAADKAILVDMFLFALDNPPPSSILLISGDVDFAPALHILGQRGYIIILAIPSGVSVSLALRNAGRFVWDWPTVVRGEGFVPSKCVCTRNMEPSYLIAPSRDHPDFPIEEEAIVYKGVRHKEYSSEVNDNHISRQCSTSHISQELSRVSHTLSQYTSNTVTFPIPLSSRSQSLPSGPTGSPLEVSASGELGEGELSWVKPGDVQGLKGQIMKLIRLLGGTLPLVRLPSEYHKLYGRPLYVSEYGYSKLVHLLKKMQDAISVDGKGNRKFLSLRPSMDKCGRSVMIFPPGPTKKEKKGKGIMQQDTTAYVEACESNLLCEGVKNLSCSSNDSSDDETAPQQENRTPEVSVTAGKKSFREARIDKFRLELQELLVSYSCRILLNSFEVLYEQRYKKSLNYQSFGVNHLEDLIGKVSDVAAIHEEAGTGRKFLSVS